MENKKSNNRIFTGILFLVLGVLLFAQNLNFINLEISEYLFRWQSILIFIGIFAIARKPHRLTGYVLIFLGAVFFIPVLFGVSVHIIIWPAMLIGVGTLILFKGFFLQHFPNRKHAFANCKNHDFEIKIEKREN